MFAKSLSDWLQQRGMRVNLTGAYCCLNPWRAANLSFLGFSRSTEAFIEESPTAITHDLSVLHILSSV